VEVDAVEQRRGGLTEDLRRDQESLEERQWQFNGGFEERGNAIAQQNRIIS
jgi:hypothetical protein